MVESTALRLLDDSSRARARLRSDRPVDPRGKCVLYWMQRAQRATDNPALDAAIAAGNALNLPVVAFLGPVPFFPRANERHYAFLLEGVPELAGAVAKRGCGFLFRPWPNHRLDAVAAELEPALVIGDENPLRETERWRTLAAERLSVPLVTIDADVVVPTALFEKEEYGARTLRPKLHRVLADYLVPDARSRARVPCPPVLLKTSEPIDVARVLARLPLDRAAKPVSSYRGGTRAGERRLAEFLERALPDYDERRNHPEDALGTSRLSPWLHFGQLGPRQIALAVMDAGAPEVSRRAFLEQLVVRRELAWNFVLRNPRYDSVLGAKGWAQVTLGQHAADPRPHRYGDEQLELGRTHDPLWNAAQHEMLYTGHMHNYVRMYWAKKILEWSDDPERAFEVAIRLNDRYELDGRDPNGYTGIAWAIGGIHDRAWGPVRPVFGTIRFMSFASTSRKFDSKAYIARVAALAREQGRGARS